jgi:hypothetical protein
MEPLIKRRQRDMTEKVYCDVCDEYVEPTRLNFEHKYHELLFFMVVLTCGVGFIIYLILKYRKKPHYCPNCEKKLIFEE